jgi:cytoskeleton protein RodZ
MAKREPEIEASDETPVEASEPTVGERLRAAREKMGLSLEDIAAQTRIPQRHLESIEKADWDALPAPTYTTGFAKSYASAVGLDRTDIGDQLRAEMGGQRFTANTMETFEPADPRRSMPKWLVIGTIVALVVIVAVMSWLNNRSLEQTDNATNAPAATAGNAPPAAQQPVRPATTVPAAGPVMLTATDAVWMQITGAGGTTLFSGILQGGQTFTIPPQSNGVMLKTAKPEALKITVGGRPVPQVGPPAKKVTVSLAPADLLKGPAAVASDPGPSPSPAANRTPVPSRNAPSAAAPATAPAPAQGLATTNTAA